MNTFVSLLRAVNVGGRFVRNEKLRSTFEELGYSDVKTFLQSGNVIFNSKGTNDVRKLAEEIERSLKKKVGFEITVILKTRDQISNIIQGNPFSRSKEPGHLHVTFLREEPVKPVSPADLDKARNGYEDYSLSKAQNVIYLYCPNGYGKTKLNNAFFERKFGILATTRNWRTLKSLLEV